MHKKIIKQIIENGNKEQMQNLEKVLIDAVDKLKNDNIEDYKEIKLELYKILYGNHLNEDLANEWVSHMENKDGTYGEHWTFEQTNQFAGNHNKYDFYAILNMMYSDFYNPRFDTSNYLELTRDWFNDKDGPEGKTLKYYMLIKMA